MINIAGRILHGGGDFDTVIISAPRFTKNTDHACSPEMSMSMKSKMWRFGMEIYIYTVIAVLTETAAKVSNAAEKSLVRKIPSLILAFVIVEGAGICLFLAIL